MIEREKPNQEELLSRGKEILLKSDQSFVSISIEADGIPGYGSMLSLGAVTTVGESFYSEIRPRTLDYLPAYQEICETHGLERKRLIKEAPIFYQVMEKFNKWLKENTDKPVVLTGFNTAQSWSFIDLYHLYSVIENPFKQPPLDLNSLAMSFLREDKSPSIDIPQGDFASYALEVARYQQKIHFGLAGLQSEAPRNTNN